MKWLVGTFASVVAMLIGATLFINLYPPDFEVYQLDDSDPGVRIGIEPNFVVNSVYRIDISRSDRTLILHEEPRRGPVVLELPDGLEAGDVLTVRCDLQFDRWMAPAITTVEKQVVVR